MQVNLVVSQVCLSSRWLWGNSRIVIVHKLLDYYSKVVLPYMAGGRWRGAFCPQPFFASRGAGVNDTSQPIRNRLHLSRVALYCNDGSQFASTAGLWKQSSFNFLRGEKVKWRNFLNISIAGAGIWGFSHRLCAQIPHVESAG